MHFFKNNFKQTNCINGCNLFNDENNYSYWENTRATSDEKDIVEFLNNSSLSNDKKILHIGIGNSFLAKNLKKFKLIDGLTISNSELIEANKNLIPNYNVFFKNKHGKDDLTNKIDHYDIIIDNNLKSFSCCEISFDDLIKKYKKYLKHNGILITSLKGMSWSRIVKPVYSFSLKKLFHRKLKEFDGPKSNMMNLNDCKDLSSKYKFILNTNINNLIIFEKND